MPHGTVQPVIPILLFALIAVGAGVFFIVVGYLCNPRRSNPVKQMPYESGMDPIHPARRRMDVRFHLVAIAFLVFDVEILILYPWAVAFLADRAPPPSTALIEATDQTAPAAAAGSASSARQAQPAATPPHSEAPSVDQPVALPATAALAAPADGATVPEVVVQTSRAGLLRDLERPVSVRPPHLFASGAVFLLLLVLGYAYDWRKGVFDWL